MENIEIKFYQLLNKDLASQWKEFEKNSDHYYFQTYEWQKNWYYQILKYKKNFKVFVIIIKKNNTPIILLPMCIQKIFCFKILKWSGFPFSDYNAPLIKKDLIINKNEFFEIFNLIIRKYKNLFNCINLINQPFNINKTVNPFTVFFKNYELNKYYRINFNKNFQINEKENKDLNYQIKRLKKLGNVQFHLATKKKDIKKIINFIIKNKSIQYDRTKAWNLFKLNTFKLIFILINLKSMSRYITYLTLDKKIIAAHSGFIYNKRCYYLFPAYDYYFRKFAAGKILLDFIYKDCIRKNCDYLDLTIGSEQYKVKWSNEISTSNNYLKSISTIGYIYILLIKFKNYLKKKNDNRS
jgi:CelD/BcsL family acetyltransferase involved in cellulose biosynthesis